MKRWLAFLCTLMLLVQPVGNVHAGDTATTPEMDTTTATVAETTIPTVDGTTTTMGEGTTPTTGEGTTSTTGEGTTTTTGEGTTTTTGEGTTTTTGEGTTPTTGEGTTPTTGEGTTTTTGEGTTPTTGEGTTPTTGEGATSTTGEGTTPTTGEGTTTTTGEGTTTTTGEGATTTSTTTTTGEGATTTPTTPTTGEGTTTTTGEGTTTTTGEGTTTTTGEGTTTTTGEGTTPTTGEGTTPTTGEGTTPTTGESTTPTTGEGTTATTGEGTTPTTSEQQCAECGGTPLFDHWIDAEGGHERACPHGVVQEGSFQAHEYSWTWSEEQHWKQCTVCEKTVNVEGHYAICSESTTVCGICGASSDKGAIISVDHDGLSSWIKDEVNHWKVCSECKGELPGSRFEHTNRSCNNNDACDACGATKDSVAVKHGNSVFGSDGAEHWFVCTTCNNEIPDTRSNHIVRCKNPGVCADCGVQFSGELVHNWPDDYASDTQEHWKVCADCPEVINRGDHYANCNDINHCAECGADYKGYNIVHLNTNETYEYDETGHWLTCTGCKKTYDRNSHHALCTPQDQGKCDVCGAAYTGNNIIHQNVQPGYVSDDAQHWQVCTECGGKAFIADHMERCNKPGVCADCGVAYTGKWKNHNWAESTIESNEVSHWKYCPDCKSEYNRSEHAADCGAPGTCADCGVAYTGNRRNHRGLSDTYEHNEMQHWRVCSVCNKKVDVTVHEERCNNPGKCAVCGVAYTGVRLEHDWSSKEIEHDETKHWRICPDCRKEFDYGEHYADCDNPGKCATCGVAYTGSNVTHSTDGIHYHDATKHWQVCTVCKKNVYVDNHVRRCSDEGKCFQCNADYTGGELEHNWGESYYVPGETEHWRICPDCNAEFARGSHFAECDAPTKCAECGAAYSGDTIVHRNVKPGYGSDATQHWQVCLVCKQEVYFNNHVERCDKPGKCADCGAAFTGEWMHHFWSEPYEHDAETHWMVCSNCKEKFNLGGHFAACNALGTCVECGIAYTGEHVSHTVTDVTFRRDEKQHWQVCSVCPEKVNPRDHLVQCDKPGKCYQCDMDFASEDVWHKGPRIISSTETEHWATCSACKKEVEGSRNPHWGNDGCTVEIHTCLYCETEYVPEHIMHNYSKVQYEPNADGHLRVCADCGKPMSDRVEVTPHYVTCNDQTHCAGCGVELDANKNYYVQHIITEDSAWGHDRLQHWKICDACGKFVNVEPHFVLCSDKTRSCFDCKAQDIDVFIQHEYAEVLKFDSEYHWYSCTSCGETVSDWHYSSCDESNNCIECDYVGEMEPIVHYDTESFHDSDKHWTECMTCHVVDYEEPHYATCTNPHVCDYCGISQGINIHNIIHSYEPTSYEGDGTNHWYTCILCEEEVVEAHTPSEEDPSVCAACGKEIVAPHAHEWVTTETPATCTKDGSIVKTCACGETTTEPIPALGHDWADPVVVDATCTKDGSTTIACTRCDEKTVEPIPALGHDWADPVVVDATCTKDGSTTIACTRCEEKTVEPIPATGHAWADPVTIVEASCTTDGSAEVTCSKCSDKTTQAIPATGHDWGEPVTTVPATCTTDGSAEVTCQSCDEKTTEAIPATGHDWGEPVTVVEATCTTEGSAEVTCQSCDEKTTQTIPATGHDWGEPVTIVEATCTTDGSAELACQNCDVKTVETIPATGHDWADAVIVDATCTKEGSIVRECYNCDELSVSYIPMVSHTFAVTARVAPTCTAEGYTVSTCSGCGAESTDTIAATGHNYDIVVYVSQNDGTHGTDCLNGCGAKMIERCDLVTTTVGNMLCSACAVCGYAEYTMQAVSSEIIESDVTADIQIVRVENAVIEPVAAEEAPLPDDIELVVHLTVPAVPMALDNEVQGKVEKLFAVNLISKGVSIQPTGMVHLSIPYDNEEEIDLSVMKLVLLCEDGTLKEIAYELIDGMIVFDTDLVGVFALMRADELV